MKKRETQKDIKKFVLCGMGSLMEKLQDPGSLACLLTRVEQQGGVTRYN